MGAEESSEEESIWIVSRQTDHRFLDHHTPQDDEMCPICYETRPKNERKRLRCGHEFCVGCIVEWYTSKQHPVECPCCRAPIEDLYLESERAAKYKYKDKALYHQEEFTLDPECLC